MVAGGFPGNTSTGAIPLKPGDFGRISPCRILSGSLFFRESAVHLLAHAFPGMFAPLHTGCYVVEDDKSTFAAFYRDIV